jgi:NADPH:quinone reductase-like Zn-dependent oxidoreductase
MLADADLSPIPVVPGYEVAGRVDVVGGGVDPSWVGRDVFALTRFGGYAAIWSQGISTSISSVE